MLKKEIVEKISKYFKLTEFEAERVYDDIFSIIINGVKEDNIVDIANFGEFIVKYNNGKDENGDNGSEYKKTVEFLASSNIEDELNQDLSTAKPPAAMQTGGEVSKDESSSGFSIEDELRRKREEIISKITGPVQKKTPERELGKREGEKEDEAKTEKKVEEKKEETVKEKPAVPVSEIKEEKPAGEKERIVHPTEEKPTEEKPSEEKEAVKDTDKDEDMSSKTFSDYFSEVEGEKPAPEKKDVIPKSAVLLHNEITGGTETPGETGVPGGQFPQTEPEKQTLLPVDEKASEHVAEDNSYYIWYKDSESNPIDTQTLSYEYELLYQATKEAEYKSKLKIYVTSFILFFSIVLILLLFSPLLYKLFFSPVEIQRIENSQNTPDISEQKAIPNVIQEKDASQQTLNTPPVETSNNTQSQQETQKPEIQQQVTQQQNQTKVDQNSDNKNQDDQKTVTPPVTKQENKIQQQTSLEQAGKQQNNQTQKQKFNNKLEGVTKNSLGWMDEKLKVIYIQLENGKFTIQESAWDSNSKASKRISTIESYGIKGLKGNVVKADLGAKGTWYRARFGEFSTLEEAHRKAAELRGKENMKLAMLFMSFLMFA